MYYSSLEDLLLSNDSDYKHGENGVAYVTLNEESPSTNEIMDIIADSDRRLGLAGFLPFILQHRSAEPSSPETGRRGDELEDELVFQWRSYTRLASDCARVCFLPYTDTMEDSVYLSLLNRIERSLKALLCQIRVLDEVQGFAMSRLHFIRLKPASGEDPTKGDEHQTEICELPVNLIDDFATAFVNAKAGLKRSFLAGDGSLLNAISEAVADTSWAVALAPLLAPWAEADYFGILLAGVRLLILPTLILAKLVTYVAMHIMRLLHVDFFDDEQVLDGPEMYWLHHSVRLIMETLGLTASFGMELGLRDPLRILHFTALVVQSLTLIVQSQLRGLVTPCRFEFLTSTVSNFILEGINHQPRAGKIYASSQKLSCLGDMLKKEVLVFGLKEKDSHQQMDIIGTPAQLVELWGPAELIVKRSGPSATDTMSIGGIKINRGLLIPVGESPQGMQKWHCAWAPSWLASFNFLCSNSY
jgi:hypothetical protein